MEFLGNLLDGFGGVDELVFQLRDRLPCDGEFGRLAAVFPDDDGQVVGCHAELSGIESHVAVLAEMLLHQPVEVAALPLDMGRAGRSRAGRNDQYISSLVFNINCKDTAFFLYLPRER